MKGCKWRTIVKNWVGVEDRRKDSRAAGVALRWGEVGAEPGDRVGLGEVERTHEGIVRTCRGSQRVPRRV
jgi:hypothetical protein